MNTEKLILLWHDIKAKLYTFLLSPNFYQIGQKSTIIPPFRFKNLIKISLGKNVVIHSNCWIHVIKNGREDTSPKLIIGDYVCIGMSSTISAIKKIVIEKYVFTARNVYISDNAHEFHDVSLPIALQGIGKIAEVKIGANSWLGQNAIVLPGVTIGKHCVIGANSVVNRDIPNFSIAAGIPAKVIRTFNPKTICWERVNNNE